MKKYGPAPLPARERRLLITLSLSNKGYPRLARLRACADFKEAHSLSNREIEALVEALAYRAIDAYCEAVEREQ